MSFQPSLIVFGRRLIIKRLVRSDIVISLIPVLQLPVVFSQGRADIFDFIKLLSVGPVGPLHEALQLRCPGRDYEQPDLLGPLAFERGQLRLGADLGEHLGQGRTKARANLDVGVSHHRRDDPCLREQALHEGHLNLDGVLAGVGARVGLALLRSGEECRGGFRVDLDGPQGLRHGHLALPGERVYGTVLVVRSQPGVDPQLAGLHGLWFRFGKRRFSRLRQLIDAINEL